MQTCCQVPRTGRDGVGDVPRPFFALTQETPRLDAVSSVLELGRPRLKTGLPTSWVTLGRLPALQASCLICKGTILLIS